MPEVLDAFLDHEAAIRRYLSRFSSNADDIEDFLQETFLKGFAAELKYTISDPKNYLFKIAKNVALESIRKSAQAPMTPLRDSDESDVLIDEAQASADELLNGRRKLASFAMAIAHLPPRCREVFLLRHLEGLQYKQIAYRLNISVKTVEHHVAVGLVKCRAYFRELGYDPTEFGGGQATSASRSTRSEQGISNDRVRQQGD